MRRYRCWNTHRLPRNPKRTHIIIIQQVVIIAHLKLLLVVLLYFIYTALL